MPDYGYSSWLIHPVSSTIFLNLWLSQNACYSKKFQLFVQHSRRIVFPNEVPFKWTFDNHLSAWWTSAFLFRFELQLLRNANPKIRTLRVETQLRIFPFVILFKATFYRSSDVLKIVNEIYSCQVFSCFWINEVQPIVINNC